MEQLPTTTDSQRRIVLLPGETMSNTLFALYKWLTQSKSYRKQVQRIRNLFRLIVRFKEYETHTRIAIGSNTHRSSRIRLENGLLNAVRLSSKILPISLKCCWRTKNSDGERVDPELRPSFVLRTFLPSTDSVDFLSGEKERMTFSFANIVWGIVLL